MQPLNNDPEIGLRELGVFKSVKEKNVSESRIRHIEKSNKISRMFVYLIKLDHITVPFTESRALAKKFDCGNDTAKRAIVSLMNTRKWVNAVLISSHYYSIDGKQLDPITSECRQRAIEKHTDSLLIGNK